MKSLISYLPNFLDYLEIEKNLSSKSQENYAQWLKRFTSWLKLKKLEGITPEELTKDHVWQYRLYLSRNNKITKSTQRCYLIALRSLLSYFSEHDIPSLPPDKIKLGRDKDEKVVRFLSLEQMEKLFAAPDRRTLQGKRDYAILQLFFSTGMRVSELVGLNRKQIRV